MELFIPAKLRTNEILGKGFGKADLKRLVAVALLGGAVGLGAALFVTKDIQTILLACVIVGCLFGGAAYFSLLKNDLNLSLWDLLKLFVRFLRAQRYYPYQKTKEWS